MFCDTQRLNNSSKLQSSRPGAYMTEKKGGWCAEKLENYPFPIDLAPNGIPFVAKSIGNM